MLHGKELYRPPRKKKKRGHGKKALSVILSATMAIGGIIGLANTGYIADTEATEPAKAIAFNEGSAINGFVSNNVLNFPVLNTESETIINSNTTYYNINGKKYVPIKVEEEKSLFNSFDDDNVIKLVPAKETMDANTFGTLKFNDSSTATYSKSTEASDATGPLDALRKIVKSTLSEKEAAIFGSDNEDGKVISAHFLPETSTSGYTNNRELIFKSITGDGFWVDDQNRTPGEITFDTTSSGKYYKYDNTTKVDKAAVNTDYKILPEIQIKAGNITDSSTNESRALMVIKNDIDASTSSTLSNYSYSGTSSEISSGKYAPVPQAGQNWNVKLGVITNAGGDTLSINDTAFSGSHTALPVANVSMNQSYTIPVTGVDTTSNGSTNRFISCLLYDATTNSGRILAYQRLMKVSDLAANGNKVEIDIPEADGSTWVRNRSYVVALFEESDFGEGKTSTLSSPVYFELSTSQRANLRNVTTDPTKTTTYPKVAKEDPGHSASDGVIAAATITDNDYKDGDVITPSIKLTTPEGEFDVDAAKEGTDPQVYVYYYHLTSDGSVGTLVDPSDLKDPGKYVAKIEANDDLDDNPVEGGAIVVFDVEPRKIDPATITVTPIGEAIAAATGTDLSLLSPDPITSVTVPKASGGNKNLSRAKGEFAETFKIGTTEVETATTVPGDYTTIVTINHDYYTDMTGNDIVKESPLSIKKPAAVLDNVKPDATNPYIDGEGNNKNSGTATVANNEYKDGETVRPTFLITLADDTTVPIDSGVATDDYTITYYPLDETGKITGDPIAKADLKDVGDYVAKIDGGNDGDIKGTCWIRFPVTPRAINSNDIAFGVNSPFKPLNVAFTNIVHDVTFPRLDGTTFEATAPADYSVTYEDTAGNPVILASTEGTYIAVVTLKGSYTGTAKKNFQAKKAAGDLTNTKPDPSSVFTDENGNAINPATSTVTNNEYRDGNTVKPRFVVTMNDDSTLPIDTSAETDDYTITYYALDDSSKITGSAIPKAQLSEVGNYVAKIDGGADGDITGSCWVRFPVIKRTIDASDFDITVNSPFKPLNVDFTGIVTSVKFPRADGGTYTASPDEYTVTYKDGTGNIVTKATDEAAYKAVVTLKGNYMGSGEKGFLAKKYIADMSTAVPDTTKPYTDTDGTAKNGGKADVSNNEYKDGDNVRPKFDVTLEDGNVIPIDTSDTSGEFEVEYYKLDDTGKITGEAIPVDKLTDTGKYVAVINGGDTGDITGECRIVFDVIPREIDPAKVTVTVKTPFIGLNTPFNGVVTSVSFPKADGTTYIASMPADYTVSYTDKSDAVVAQAGVEDTYKAIVTLCGNYKGVIPKEFEVKATDGSNNNNNNNTDNSNNSGGSSSGGSSSGGSSSSGSTRGTSTINYNAFPFNGPYDGQAHTIRIVVTRPTSNYTVTYSTDNKTFNSVLPSYKEVGTYTIYYRIVASGYTTVNSNAKVIITAASDTKDGTGEDTNNKIKITKKNYTGTYDKKAHKAKVVVSNASDAVIKYGKKSGTYNLDSAPSYKAAGTHKVYYQVTSDQLNDPATGTLTVKIKKAKTSVSASGYSGAYDGKNHYISVTPTASGSTIKYSAKKSSGYKSSNIGFSTGTHTVYYKVTNKNYKTVSGHRSISIAGGPVATDNTAVKPDTTKPSTTPSVTPTPSYQPTVKPSVSQTGSGSGSSTSKETTTTTTTTEKKSSFGSLKDDEPDPDPSAFLLTMTCNVESFKGEYDGSGHTIKVTPVEVDSGYTITYATKKKGKYTTENPSFSEVGKYKVYYKVKAPGYKTKKGKGTIEITEPTHAPANNGTIGSFTVSSVPALDDGSVSDKDYFSGLNLEEIYVMRDGVPFITTTNSGDINEAAKEDKQTANDIFKYYTYHMGELGKNTNCAQITDLEAKGPIASTVNGLIAFDMQESDAQKIQASKAEDGMCDVNVTCQVFEEGKLYMVVHKSIARNVYDILLVQGEAGQINFRLPDLSPFAVAAVGVASYAAPDVEPEKGVNIIAIILLILILILIVMIVLYILNDKDKLPRRLEFYDVWDDKLAALFGA